MPQTLLAIFSVVTVSLLSLNHQQAGMHTRMSMIRTEIETQAETVAMEVLEDLRRVPFDGAIVRGETIDSEDDFEALSSASFEHDSKERTVEFQAVTNLSDLKKARPHAMKRTSKYGDIDFTVITDVRFVRHTGDEVEATVNRSFTKEVVILVKHPMLKSPVTISRIYSHQR